MTPTDRLEQLHTLNEIGAILNRELEFKNALSPALTRLVKLLDLSTGWVFLSKLSQGNAQQGGFELAAHEHLPPALETQQQALLCSGSCECQSMFRHGELESGVNIVTCSRLKNTQDDTRGLRVHASIPLVAKNGAIGIMNLAAADNRAFTTDRLAFLTAVGQQLGVAFERSRLQASRTREIRYMATLEERQRLARDMHDSVTQLLFAADLALSADKQLSSNGLRAHASVQAALQELRGLIEITRSADLSQGLVSALTRLTERTTGSPQIYLQAEDIHMPATLEDELYRIAQEALHNALRHAGASHIWLELSSTAQFVVLVIRDDGQGFRKRTPGLGLASMRERAAALAGTLSLTSTNKGSEIRVEVPWSTNF